MADPGTLHHVELRVSNLQSAIPSWGWLLLALGYEPYQDWTGGCSWTKGPTYLVLEEQPDHGEYDRRRPGLSHLAFHAGSAADVDRLWSAATQHGWSHLYSDCHPFAGGPGHYAAFLENGDRFKVELVAADAVR